jgi:hypothetical protein
MSEVKKIFTDIYNNNRWEGVSRSGPGSDPDAVISVQRGLKSFIIERDIFNIIDAPCGEFGWQEGFLHQFNIYRGIDIVDEVIHKNIDRTMGRLNLSFKIGDLMHDPLPLSDLVIVRDLLIHLPLQYCIEVIANILYSGTRYIAFTHFPDCPGNKNVKPGGYVERNMMVSPFSLGQPVRIIDETRVTTNGHVWPRKQLLVFGVENKFLPGR